MLLQKDYTGREIRLLRECEKVVVENDYRKDLSHSYKKGEVLIDEIDIIDPETLIPWFASFSYSNLTKEKRVKLLEAVAEMNKRTNGTIFRSSSDSAQTIRVNALLGHTEIINKKITKTLNKKFMEEVTGYFQELEDIIKND